jgi:hypothetical protein
VGRFGKTAEELAGGNAPAPKKGRFGRTADDLAASPSAPAPVAAPEAPTEDEPDFASRAVDTVGAMGNAFLPAGFREKVGGALKSAEDFTAPLKAYDPSGIPLVGATFKPATATNVGISDLFRQARGLVEESNKPSTAIRSAVRGAEQGATFGFADEALKAVDPDTDYRALFKKSAEEAPLSTEQGHLAGTMARDAALGKALGVLGPLKNILYGAASGGLEGAGRTEASPTEEPGRFAFDTGVGAVTNAAMSAMSPQTIEPIRENIGKALAAKGDAAVSQRADELNAKKSETEGKVQGAIGKILEKLKSEKAKLEESATTLGEDRAKIVTDKANRALRKEQAERQRAEAEAAKRDETVNSEIDKTTAKARKAALKDVESEVRGSAAKEQKKSLISGRLQDLLQKIEAEKAKAFRGEVTDATKATVGQKQKLSAQERKLADLAQQEADIPASVAAKRAQMFGEAGNRISRHEELVGPLPEELAPVKQKIVESYKNNSAEHIQDPDAAAAAYEAKLRQKITDARESLSRESDAAGGGIEGQIDPLSILGPEKVAAIAAQHGIPQERIPELLKAPDAPQSRVPELEAQAASLRDELAGLDKAPEDPLAAVDADTVFNILKKHGLEKTYPGPGKKVNARELLAGENGPTLSERIADAIRAAKTPAAKAAPDDYGPFDQATAASESGQKPSVELDADPRIPRILRREAKVQSALRDVSDRMERPGEGDPQIEAAKARIDELAAKAKPAAIKAAGATQIKSAMANKFADSPLKSVVGLGTPVLGAAWKAATQRVPDGSFKNPAARAAFFDYLSQKIGTDATLAKSYGGFLAGAAQRHDLNDLLQALYYVDHDPKLAAAVGR